MDRRVRKTHKAIMQAYFDLIRENKTTKVSVSDIARKADIDRKTFYLHFDSVDQVLEKYINERVTYIDSLLEENNYFSDPFDVEKVYSIMEMVQKDDIKFLTLISKSDTYNELWIRIQRSISEKAFQINRSKFDIPQQTLRLIAEYFTSGVISIYRRWLKGELDMGLHELVEQVSTMSHFGIGHYLELPSKN